MRPLLFTHQVASALFLLAIVVFELGQFSVVLWRRRRGAATRLDRGSLPAIFVTTGIGVAAAFLLGSAARWAAIAPGQPAVRWAVFGVGIAAMLLGALVRGWAIVTLGRFFTFDVRVAADQRVVEGGPYRWVRHPSYTGLVLLFVGIGLTLGNWLSLLVICVLPTIGLVRRIHVEEAALFGNLGEPYKRYAAGKQRLVPRVW